MTRTVTFAPVRKTIQIKASQDRAFEVFATGRWWPKQHTLLGAGSPREELVIEPKAGGRWFERGADGSECDWGKVLVWAPPDRLVLGWQINGHFQADPSATTEVELKFIPEGPETTRVELEHRHFERFGDTAEALRKGVDAPDGWGGVLRAFAQAAELPV